jgi:hypothetical protein
LLKRGRVGEIEPLQADKTRLADAYDHLLGELRKDPALFATVAPTLRDELIAVTDRLQRAIQRNAQAIKAARDINRRLVATIVEAAATEQARGRGYSRTGDRAAPAAPRRSETVSLTLDQHL